MKILHCSDLHLGRRPVGGPGSDYSNIRYEDYFSAFDSIAEYSSDNEIDLMMITGDVFDKKEIRPDILSKAMDIFKKITSAGTEILLIEGNHDKGFLEQDTWLKYVAREEMIRFVDSYGFENGVRMYNPEKIGGFNFYGLGYPGSLVNEIMGDLAESLEGGNNIIMVHTDIDTGGQDFFPGLVRKEVLDKFKGRCIYIAGGHIHFYHEYPSENPYFFVPGCPEYWDIKERKDRGFIVFDTDTGRREFVSSEDFRRKKIDLTYRVVEETFEEFRSNFRCFIDEFMNSEVMYRPLVTMELRLENTKFGIYADEMEKQIESAGALKSSVTINRPKKEDGYSEKTNDNSRNIREIESDIIRENDSWAEFRHVSEKMANLLEMMKITQAEEDYVRFSENMDGMLSEMLGEADENED